MRVRIEIPKAYEVSSCFCDEYNRIRFTFPSWQIHFRRREAITGIGEIREAGDLKTYYHDADGEAEIIDARIIIYDFVDKGEALDVFIYVGINGYFKEGTRISGKLNCRTGGMSCFYIKQLPIDIIR